MELNSLKMITKASCILALLSPLAMLGSACNNSDPLAPEQDKAQGKPEVPRIHFVLPSAIQVHQNDPNVIWYDDFNEGEKEYLESRGDLDAAESFGASGSAMRAGFKQGDVTGEGDRKLAFGDFPGQRGPIVREGETFDEIYWRVYVKYQYGWQGSPKKMSRATSIVSEQWQQAMILHVWSGKENTLTLDPASGVEGQSSKIITTKYNDFDKLNWLGNSPSSEFQISSTEESGYWILVEAHARLNTPGKSDGLARLWIDGRLEAERVNMNFRGSYVGHGINAVFLESYWNDGSPKTQGRWYDNFVVSTSRIGPLVCPSNPTLFRTPYHGPEALSSWEVQVATDQEGIDTVYGSNPLDTSESVVINVENGDFSGSHTGWDELSPDYSYFCRVRQQSTNGEWSDWSRWHQNFKVEL